MRTLTAFFVLIALLWCLPTTAQSEIRIDTADVHLIVTQHDDRSSIASTRLIFWDERVQEGIYDKSTFTIVEQHHSGRSDTTSCILTKENSIYTIDGETHEITGQAAGAIGYTFFWSARIEEITIGDSTRRNIDRDEGSMVKIEYSLLKGL